MPPALDFNVRTRLERHLQQRLDNRPWVEGCLQRKTASFPYRVAEKGPATMDRHLSVPNPQIWTRPTPCQNHKPRYVINIPLRHYPGEIDTEPFTHLLGLIQNESFGKTTEASKQEVKQRVVVVIGINQIQSIDPAMNRAFKSFFDVLPRIQGLAYRVYGFFWIPKWTFCGELKGDIYKKEKAFLLLKALSHADLDIATPVRTRWEGDATRLHPDIVSQVPYQGIRTTIQRSQETRLGVKRFEESAKENPVYYVVMDADLSALRKGEGLFTRIDQCIQMRGLPSVVSLGYSVAQTEPPLLRTGIKIDMLVRQALGYLAYFPEPCSAFLVRRPNEDNHLLKLSFEGRGETLENRRLYQSGIATGVLKRDAVFVADGGVTMGTPGRMLTLKNQSVAILTKKSLKVKKNLQAIKGTRQTHASSLKWAENIYTGLDFSCSKVAEAREPLSYIFKVYDPISRMFATPGRYSTKVFDAVMTQYHGPLSDGDQNLLNTAKGKLSKLGMTKAMMDEVEAAAKRSGEAIYQELLARTS